MLEDIERSEMIAGIDEAGRGPLAGPVVAAAVVLHPEKSISGLADSKKISHKKRVHLSAEIKNHSLAWGIGCATATEIDEINIHHATLLAMQRAYNAMHVEVKHVLVDGLYCPEINTSCTAIVKGDQSVLEISAASILAKVTRDAEMFEHHKIMPEYGFDQHKGYPTTQHIAALKKFGPCDLHRRSYKPVRDAMALQERSLVEISKAEV